VRARRVGLAIGQLRGRERLLAGMTRVLPESAGLGVIAIVAAERLPELWHLRVERVHVPCVCAHTPIRMCTHPNLLVQKIGIDAHDRSSEPTGVVEARVCVVLLGRGGLPSRD